MIFYIFLELALFSFSKHDIIIGYCNKTARFIII